jgi:tetratricopeptide (TPR) repeat protein
MVTKNNNKKLQAERDAQNNCACQLAYDGNYDDAITIFNALLATDPNDVRALSNLATVLGKSGRYDESLDLFEKLVASAPGILSNRICCINLLTFLGKHTRARECYREMPQPGAIESMMLGSLSEDFKKRNSRSRSGTQQDSAIKREKNLSDAKEGKQSDAAPRFISLIWAGAPPI